MHLIPKQTYINLSKFCN